MARRGRLDPSLREALKRYELHGIRETGYEFGRGSYAAVIEVDYKGMRCAAKKLYDFLYDEFEGVRLVEGFAKECCLLGELRHPHIVQFLGIYFDPATCPVLVTEVLPVTLAECVDCYGRLPTEICYTIICDVALGLRYLHEQHPPLVHRNLSANNVMLTRDMVTKIADFGGVKSLQISCRTMTPGPGTPSYMPPEALRPNPRYDIRLDIFSFGVMMVHVLCGQWPFPSEVTRVDPHNPAGVIGLSEVERRAQYLDIISRPSEGHPLMALIERCLSNSPEYRPSALFLVERMSDVLAQQPLTISNRVDMMQRIDSIKTQEDTGGTADLRRAIVAQLKPYTRKATPTGKVLGSGTYGSVIELISARETLAGKVFRMSSSVNLQAIAFRVCGEVSTMMQLHHLNIVQCRGVSLLTDQPFPVLLMERMMSSLYAYLLDPDNSNLSVEKKVFILHDTASGLDYLHNQTPAIIHRDLTARNVLLDSQLRAKISDFGNSRIMDLDPETTPETLTSLPGTLEYMPPEALGGSVAYDPSLDVFSFGHLSLFTVTQTPVQLLPATYPDRSTDKVHGRSEVKRREGAVEAAEQLLSEYHTLVAMMKKCLHNNPAQRPRTGELVTRLQEMVTRGNAASISADNHSPSHGRGPDNIPTEKSSSATGRYASFKPDMINLRRLLTHVGVINIMEESATKYRHIGVILLRDTNGTIVDGIEKSVRGEPLEAVHNIYARWMREDVNYSWRKLIQCFRECGLNVLARNIEDYIF